MFVHSATAAAPARWHSVHVALVASVWILVWVLVSLIEIVPAVHDVRVPLWQPLVALVVPSAVVTAWLALELRFTRYDQPPLNPPQHWFARHLRRVPLFVLVSVGAVHGIRYAVFTWVGGYPLYRPPLHVLVPWEAFKASLLYCLWLALVFGVLTLTRWREDAQRMLGVQKALAEAQLSQLQAQLRPHFIFNALNTVSSLMHTDVGKADRVLAQLGDLLRANLRAGRQPEVSLQEELELLERYAGIMRERFEGRVELEWSVAPETLRARVPIMLLQPLLENAFKHGVERSSAVVRITVRVVRVGEELRIDIQNTGPKADYGAASGLGLQNCRERLYLLYETRASLSMTDAAGGGVVARVTLPWQPALP